MQIITILIKYDKKINVELSENLWFAPACDVVKCLIAHSSSIGQKLAAHLGSGVPVKAGMVVEGCCGCQIIWKQTQCWLAFVLSFSFRCWLLTGIYILHCLDVGPFSCSPSRCWGLSFFLWNLTKDMVFSCHFILFPLCQTLRMCCFSSRNINDCNCIFPVWNNLCSVSSQALQHKDMKCKPRIWFYHNRLGHETWPSWLGSGNWGWNSWPDSGLVNYFSQQKRSDKLFMIKRTITSSNANAHPRSPCQVQDFLLVDISLQSLEETTAILGGVLPRHALFKAEEWWQLWNNVDKTFPPCRSPISQHPAIAQGLSHITKTSLVSRHFTPDLRKSEPKAANDCAQAPFGPSFFLGTWKWKHQPDKNRHHSNPQTPQKVFRIIWFFLWIFFTMPIFVSGCAHAQVYVSLCTWQKLIFIFDAWYLWHERNVKHTESRHLLCAWRPSIATLRLHSSPRAPKELAWTRSKIPRPQSMPQTKPRSAHTIPVLSPHWHQLRSGDFPLIPNSD